MALEDYQKKRTFAKTPEPTGGKPDDEKLHFVIQKHHATHLHYDFRLELKGLLKSWAVPKGPSMNPEDHRLAQAVEDHPYDYKDFEGIIPKGQYGGGTVIIWDQGTYEPVEKFKTKKEQEHHLMSHYYKGYLQITLQGSKLKGRFELVRKPERGENSWLLSKMEDRFALKSDILKKGASVVSGLTIEGMAGNEHARQWQSNRSSTTQDQEETSPLRLIETGKSAPSLSKIEPMLATLVPEPFNDPDWLYELKFDGYRVQAHLKNGQCRLFSRKYQDYTDRFAVIAAEITKIRHQVVLDGEVVLLNSKGQPDFDALQGYDGKGLLVYYAFDLLWIDGYDVTGLALTDRKRILQNILPETELLRYSRHFDDGPGLFELVKQQDLEGIVAKRKGSIYKPGKRTTDWLKVTTRKVQEFVVGGWTESETGDGFRSIVFGNYQNGRFTYVGHAGHGFKDNERYAILGKLKKLEIKKCPFADPVSTSTTPHWIKPELVISVEFATYTKGGSIRKPATFKGFRQDKSPLEVTPENALTARQEREAVENKKKKQSVDTGKSAAGTKRILTTAEDSNWPEIEKLEVTSENLLPVEGEEVRVTNIEKVLWSKPEVRKADLFSYYIAMQRYILPYLFKRPLSLHLKPFAPTARGLYIKDMEGREPRFAETFRADRKHARAGKRDVIDYLVCNNLPTLVYAINLGAIDLNPWSSRTDSFDTPDYITVDLDPSDDDFSKAVETAKAAKAIFGKYKLEGLVKTSGKTGIHLLLPCAGFSFPQARTIGEHLCDAIHLQIPDLTTRERSVAKRGNRLFVDDSQNDFSDTIACPYSVRPFHLPAVSTPLDWQELKASLDPMKFTIQTVPERVQKQGDLFVKVFDRRVAKKNTLHLKRFL